MKNLDRWAEDHGEIRMSKAQFEREEHMFAEGQNFECAGCGELYYKDELILGLCPACWVAIYSD